MELVASFFIVPRLIIVNESEINFKYSNMKDNINNTNFGEVATDNKNISSKHILEIPGYVCLSLFIGMKSL